MKRYIFIIFAVVSLVSFCTGCTTLSNDTKIMAVQDLRLVPIDYEVIGDTSAEESRMSVFGIDWAHLFKDQFTMDIREGEEGFFTWTGLENMAKRGAMYKALQKVPHADRILEPRWSVEVNNYLIAKTVTVKLTAKAIKYTQSNPNSK